MSMENEGRQHIGPCVENFKVAVDYRQQDDEARVRTAQTRN
jgi:hypothetical protein